MEGGEIKNFTQVWLSVLVSLCYCYTISKIAPKGVTRLLTILPIVSLFLALPLSLTSIHLGGTTAFFIAWLANFKLLLFAFGQGPLSSYPSISLGRFIAVGCLPIKIQHHPPQVHGDPSPKIDPKSQINGDPSPKCDPNSQKNGDPSPKIDPKSQINGDPSPKCDPNSEKKGDPSQIVQNKQHPSPKTTKNGSKSRLNYAIKLLLVFMLLRVYDYSEYIHPIVIMIFYCCHIYFCLEILLAMVAAMAQVFLGVELEPQFNEPYLSTSLQDFWGRRWNLMVTSILRPSVYEPVLHFSTMLIGRKWAPLPASLSTFVVSGIMHELIFYYLGRARPSGDITWFFLLHGVCLMAEIAVKKKINRRYRLHPLVSGFMAVGFVTTTGLWLFVPPLLRCKTDDRAFDEKAFGEYAAMGAFVKDVWSRLKSFNPERVV